jgi:cytochrome c-type biogenesis protein CcsB
VAPFAFLAMAYASFGTETHIQPLIPALQSNWLIAHVVTCFLGYAAFAVSCGGAVVFLGSKKRAELIPDQDTLDEVIYRTVLLGFLLLTAGIATGAVWAEQAWGAYWSWDPKETWSLITWFLYAVIIHARMMRGWRGRRVAWLSIIGFAAVLFTYFGVNYLLAGLHSYAG